jgi:hypothetical protein
MEKSIEINFKQALLHPDSVFSSPQELRDYPGLSRKQKIKIFRNWAYEAKAANIAKEENIRFGRYSQLNEILLALSDVISD